MRWPHSPEDHDDVDDNLAVPAESADWRGEAESDDAGDDEDEFLAGVREEARMDEWLALYWGNA